MMIAKASFALRLIIAVAIMSAVADAATDPKLAETPISQLSGMPPTKRIAIYDTAVELYLKAVRKFHPEVVKEFEQFFTITPENDGKPVGYQEYLDEIDSLLKDEGHTGIGPNKTKAYGVVNDVGLRHYKELRAQPAKAK